MSLPLLTEDSVIAAILSCRLQQLLFWPNLCSLVHTVEKPNQSNEIEMSWAVVRLYKLLGQTPLLLFFFYWSFLCRFAFDGDVFFLECPQTSMTEWRLDKVYKRYSDNC